MTTQTPLETRTAFNEAVATAQAAAAAYYDAAAIIMSDYDYDMLFDAITDAKIAHPEWNDAGITTEVAAGQSVGGTVTHAAPMLSMSKSKEIADIATFVSDLNGSPVVVEPKLDGVAISAIYIDGTRTQLATRGDGNTGELISSDTVIAGLPTTIPAEGTVEVRGEVFMTDGDFDISNTARIASGKPAFANPRNATAGTLRRETHHYVAQMSFGAYEAFGDPLADVDSYLDRMHTLTSWGVTTALSLVSDGDTYATTATTDPADVTDRITALGDVRSANGLGYGIDGAVVKVVSTIKRDTLGNSTRAPRWATAFKYPPTETTSILRNIVVAVGRTGRMSLTGIIDPVTIDGSTVGRATLHNVDYLSAQGGLGLGSTVLVRKQNDIIPSLHGIDGGSDGVTAWTPPETHDCGHEWNKSQVVWRCPNPVCSIAGMLTYWCSRDAMDVDIAGEAVCEAIVDNGLAANVADLYNLTVNQLATLPMGTTTTGGTRMLGTANATKIVAGLEQSKSQPFNRVVTGLGIRMTGRSIGRWLASEFKTMDALRAATADDIAEINLIGDVKARSIVDGLIRLSTVIDSLAAHGVNMGTATVTVPAGTADLTGKTYVVSGSVPGYTRTTIAERIEALGGKASSSVSRKVTALVTSETSTSKAKKAAELGIPVIDPTEFAALIAE